MGTSEPQSNDSIDLKMLSSQVNCDSDNTLGIANINQVLFKGGCMYQHNVLCINYMSYNVHHDQDIFNSNSNHCDVIMLLALKMRRK